MSTGVEYQLITRWFHRRGTFGVVLSLAAGALLVSAAQPARRNHFPGAYWEERNPASLGLDGTVLDRLGVALGGRGCVVKDGYVVKTWGSQSEIGDFGWELSSKDQGVTFRHLADMTSGFRRPEPPGAAYSYSDFAIQLYPKTMFDRSDCFAASTCRALQREQLPGVPGDWA